MNRVSILPVFYFLLFLHVMLFKVLTVEESFVRVYEDRLKSYFNIFVHLQLFQNMNYKNKLW